MICNRSAILREQKARESELMGDPDASRAKNKKLKRKTCEARGIRTPNLRVWNPTRCRCAIASEGAVRESNPRPLAPEARIIPLDQRPTQILHAHSRYSS